MIATSLLGSLRGLVIDSVTYLETNREIGQHQATMSVVVDNFNSMQTRKCPWNLMPLEITPSDNDTHEDPTVLHLCS